MPRQFSREFECPNFVLNFVSECDRAVMSDRWRLINPSMDPRPLINDIRVGYREAMVNGFGSTNYGQVIDDVCDLVDLVIAATTCGHLRTFDLVNKIKSQLDKIHKVDIERPYSMEAAHVAHAFFPELIGNVAESYKAIMS